MRRARAGLLLLAGLSFVAGGVLAQEAATDYATELQEWRAGRIERLRSETGWLTLVGLYWLAPGDNRFGSDPELPVVLEAPGIPALAGTLRLEGQTVTLTPAPGVRLSIAGQPVTAPRALADDNAGEPDVIEAGRLRFYVIRRVDRFGVRVKDPESPTRTGFKGLDYFDVDPSYHVAAKLVPFDEPRQVEIATAVGTVEKLLAPGHMDFTLHGEPVSMLPLLNEPGDDELWIIFSDRTSGKETYGFRYLYAPLDESGTVDLDFNRAYNPPCAFTRYATCALPPRENRLTARIEAGEKIFGKPH